MIRIKFYIKEIDYQSMMEFIMPYIEKWMAEQDNYFYGVLSKIINENGKPTKFSNLVLSLIPKKNKLATSLISHYDEVLLDYLNNQLVMNNITAKVTAFNTNAIERSDQSMLRIVMDLDAIDYEKISEQLLTLLLPNITEKEDGLGRLTHLFMGMDDLPGKVIKAAIGAIPEAKRDELTAAVLTEYRDEVKTALNSLIIKNNLSAEICNFKVESINTPS